LAAAWTAACTPVASLPTNCAIAFRDASGNTKCAQCNANRFLDLSTMTCVVTCAAATEYGISSITYKILGVEYTGSLCGQILPSTKAFGDLYYLNVDSCEAGYYIVKTSSSLNGYTTGGAEYELIICAKCHEDCEECLDFSKYACTKCKVGSVLYMSTCISSCPVGYTPDASRICVAATCPAFTYTYNTPVECVKKCPSGFFANNNTWSCDACHADCEECWGPTSTDCRICSAASGKLAFGDGTCSACAASTSPDDHSNWKCAPMKRFEHIYNLANTLTSASPELSTITMKDLATSATVAFSLDTNSYLMVPSNNRELTLPEVKYEETRVCYRFSVEFELVLKNDPDTWHNKDITLFNNGAALFKVTVNKWDFENPDQTFPVPANTAVAYKKHNRHFVDNTNCTTQSLQLSFKSSIASSAQWGVKNFRSHWFFCPLDCISCGGSLECARCLEGKFFYAGPNECQVPYNLPLKVDEPGVVESYSFLFKPHSIFLYFSKKMNFTLGDQFPYFFPNFVAASSRLLQTTTYDWSKVEIRFISNNFLELKLNGVNVYSDMDGVYTFRYPFVDLDRNGYQFTRIPATYKANSRVSSFLLDYIKILADNKQILRYVMTGVIFVMLSAMGANWFMVENCQKLYVLLFLSIDYNNDVQLFLDLMDFSFFGWFQELHTMILGNSSYWDFVAYNEYISKTDISRSITKDFLSYIPPRNLGKFLVRKSFVVHSINLLLLFGLMTALWMILSPIRLLILKKYYYKEKLVKFFNFFHEFLHFKFFVRFIMLTFAPFIFYGLANMSKLDLTIPSGQISSYLTLTFLGIYALAWLQYFVYCFLMPSELERRNLHSGWKFKIVIPFFHFMKYLKFPETSGLNSNDAEDTDDDDPTKKNRVVNEHMIIKDTVGTNEVFTLIKDNLKKGGAKVFQVDEPKPNPKDPKQKKKKEGFISIEKVLENEEKEREAKKKLAEKQKNKKDSSSSSSSSSSDKEDADGNKEMKEGDAPVPELTKEEKAKKEQEKKAKKEKKQKKKTEKKEDSSSSDDNDKTDEEESEDELQSQDVRSIGKLLGRVAAKIEKGPGCCACKCIRKNKKIQKFNHLMERTAKFFNLIRVLHIAGIGALSWYFGDSPQLQTVIFAASQTALFVWSLLCRPYIYSMLNVSLLLVEFFFTGIAWILFLLAKPTDFIMNQLLMLVVLCLCSAIFVVSVFTFLAFWIANVVKWFSSFGEKDQL